MSGSNGVAEHPLARAAAGAIAGGALWWALNQASTVNGVGWLTRAGFPWSRFELFAAIGAVVGGIVGLLSRRRARTHAQEVEEECRRLGLAYQDSADGLRERYPGAAAMPAFRDWHASANLSSGKVRGATVEVFDLVARRTSHNSDRGSTTRTSRTTLVFMPGADLPDFSLTSKDISLRALEGLGVAGMSFDVQDMVSADAGSAREFLRLYRVDLHETPADDEQAVRRVFSPEVMRLLAGRPGWSAQASGGHLVLWRGSGGGFWTLGINGLSVSLGRGGGFVPAERRAAMAEEAAEIAEAMRAALRRPPPEPVARPDEMCEEEAEPGAERDRAGGAILGGAACGIFGFFLGGGLSGSLLFSDLRNPPVILFPILTFGGAFLGALLGAFLGRRFLPIAVTDPPVRWSRWQELGIFAGFLLGAGLGGALAVLTVIRRNDPHAWPAPILFLGGAGAGAGLGLLLGGLYANRRRRRRGE